MRLRTTHDLELHFKQSCSRVGRIYTRLVQDGNLQGREAKRAARFAVQTMGIAISLNRLDLARDIEQLFFANRPFMPTRLKLGTRHEGAKVTGLGLDRSGSKNAWIHAIALALDPQAYIGLADLSRAIEELRKIQNADPVVFAALIQRANHLIVSKTAESSRDAEHDAYDIDELKGMIDFVRKSDRFRDVEAIEFAAIEGELSRLERDEAGMTTVDSPEFLVLERAVTALTGGLDDGSFYSRQTATQAREAIRQAHVLHLSLRFLLLRARLTRSLSEPGQRSAAVSHSLSAAHSLHDALLALVQLNASAKFVHALRERQIAALFRLLWIHLYSGATSVNDPSASPRTTSLASVISSLSLLEDTISVSVLIGAPTDRRTPDARRTNLDSAVLRRLLLALVEHLPVTLSTAASSTAAASGSRHAIGLDEVPTEVATFEHLERLLNVIRAFRVHDARCLPSSSFRTKHDKPRPDLVFWRYSILWHTVRAVLLAPDAAGTAKSTAMAMAMPTRSGKMEEAGARRNPMDRLEFLLDILDEMREAGDRLRKDVIRAIVDSVVEREMVGEVWRAWRARLRARVASWSVNKPTAAWYV